MVSIVLPHHEYEVVVAAGAMTRLGELMQSVAPGKRCALIVDANVVELHGDLAETALRACGYETLLTRLPTGEANKNLDTVRSVYERLLDARLERRSPVIALGGGVTGDTAGFVAATYLRGVPFVQCPTTLLAMVDSSVGGKVGVNVPQGKNLIGSFYQPVIVVADTLLLKTLPLREIRCGLAECIKHAIIRDASLFSFIEENAEEILAVDAEVMTEVVRRNVAIKAAVVAEDERESGVRAHLNLGHTFAHAIEATTDYGPVQHGEAVGLGLIAAATTAGAIGLCGKDMAKRISDLLQKLGMMTRFPITDDDTLFATMQLDKKVRDGRINFILPATIGQVVIRNDLTREAIDAGWAAVRSS